MQVNEPQSSTGSTRRFLKAWEEAAIRNEGIHIGERQGRNAGRNEALHAMLRLILTQRFGEAAASVLPKLDSITDPTQLESLARRGLTISSIEDLLVE